MLGEKIKQLHNSGSDALKLSLWN